MTLLAGHVGALLHAVLFPIMSKLSLFQSNKSSVTIISLKLIVWSIVLYEK